MTALGIAIEVYISIIPNYTAVVSVMVMYQEFEFVLGGRRSTKLTPSRRPARSKFSSRSS